MVISSSHPTSARERLPGLDLLRAAAISLVILWHFPVAVFPFHFRPATWAGVDLFFVLSGYLIGTQLLRPYTNGRQPSFWDFFFRRMLRVMPAYVAVLGIYFLVPGFREQPNLSSPWRFLTFTFNFGLDTGKTGAFSHAWSLCVEEHFYLLLPVIVYWLMRRPSPRKTAIFAVSLVGIGILLRAVLWWHFIHNHQFVPGESLAHRFLEYIYYPTYNRLDGLVVGVVIAAIRLFRPMWWIHASEKGNTVLVTALAVLLVAFAICQKMFSFWTAVFGYPLLAAGFGLLLVASLSPQCLLARRRFFGATLVASLSYCVYLTHKEIMHLDDIYLGGWIAHLGLLRISVYLITFFIAAEILHWTVERNGYRLRDRLLGIRLSERPRFPTRM